MIAPAPLWYGALWPLRLWIALVAGALAGLRPPPARRRHRVDGHGIEHRANIILVEHGQLWHHDR